VGGFERANEPKEAEPSPAEPVATQPLSAPELLRTLSRSAGNKAVTALLQRHGAHVVEAEHQVGKATTWERVESDLSFSALGWEAMRILKDNRITLKKTTSGPIAGFQPDQNTCFINLMMPSYEIAAYFVHEMYHASQFHGKKSPAAATMAENAWVSMMVTEEVEGTVKGFMHKLALERFGRAPANDRPAGMNKFRSAYNYAYKKAIGEGKEPTEARKDGVANGVRMIRLMFTRPSRRLSADLQPNLFDTYSEYYHREWTKETKKAAAKP
jgi:hypothetical protein